MPSTPAPPAMLTGQRDATPEPATSAAASSTTPTSEDERPKSPTPRTMRVGPATPAHRPKAGVPVKRARVPNCTHVSMDRVYLEGARCSQCTRLPPLGFLYECHQDRDYGFPQSVPMPGGEHVDESAKSELRRNLERIGLSESVIATAEEGKYTSKQLEKLKAQKMDLNQVISDVLQAREANQAAQMLDAASKNPSNNDGAANSVAKQDAVPTTCSLRVCHTCRPYFIQRIYMSFDAVFSNQIRPVTILDLPTLTTKSAKVVRGISLTPPASPTSEEYPYRDAISDAPSESSITTILTTQSDLDNLDRNHRQQQKRRRFYNMGHLSSTEFASHLSRNPLFSREGLKAAFQGIFRSSRESSSQGSNITLPMPRTGLVRHQQGDESSMGEFDMNALRRVSRQKARSDLRFEMLHGRYPEASSSRGHDGEEGSSESSDSNFTVYSCISEGSEVAVSGGVALTEEAIETHTPDILSGAMLLDSEQPVLVDQLQADLESMNLIMAQL